MNRWGGTLARRRPSGGSPADEAADRAPHPCLAGMEHGHLAERVFEALLDRSQDLTGLLAPRHQAAAAQPHTEAVLEPLLRPPEGNQRFFDQVDGSARRRGPC
jgi:hypothetical protein